ncbi:hypothetical protein CQW23_05485 [Capsicum baccatum]|uniref:Uncharacterized protein n=1 Tax=Capsicum baccatum TaxID=33114 RepID=A0A2G2XHR1_CAPBA|nr:hypothetical protein CQW23_05485 [Capsicum baccatum]
MVNLLQVVVKCANHYPEVRPSISLAALMVTTIRDEDDRSIDAFARVIFFYDTEIKNDPIRQKMQVARIEDKIREGRLRWCSHDVLQPVNAPICIFETMSQRSRQEASIHGLKTAYIVKGMLTQDVQHDKLVEFCVTIAEHNIEFAMNHMILELQKQDSPSEAKVIGLRALRAIAMSPTSQHVGVEILHLTDVCYSFGLTVLAISSQK